MNRFQKYLLEKTLLFFVILIFTAGHDSSAAIVDFDDWTEDEDPNHPFLSSALVSSSLVRLSATSGPIDSETGIFYHSVNGSNAASSSNGWAFNPSSDFNIAIDYDFNAMGNNANGVLGLGFRIGEQTSGANSVSVGMLTHDGAPDTYFSVERYFDANTSTHHKDTEFKSASGSGPLSGSFMIQYDSSSGDFTLGTSTTKGATLPDITFTTTTVGGLQNRWTDADLMASFFLQADTLGAANGFTSGSADAEFSNFRVLEGSPVAVPEPSEIALVTMSFLSLWAFWYQRKNREKYQTIVEIPTRTQV